MGLRNFLSRFVRWVVTWPLLVIVALNIESLANIQGIADVLPENWGWIVATLTWAYSAATTTWVSYAAVFLLGCVFYEWVSYLSLRAEAHSPGYHRMKTKLWALSIAQVFAKNGRRRRWVGTPYLIEELNERLAIYGLPLLPELPGEDEAINRVHARYLECVSTGDFALASSLLLGTLERIRGEGHASQSPEGTATRTPH